jgi:uncharacterized protein
LKKLLARLFGGSSPESQSDGPDLAGFVEFVVKGLADAPGNVRVDSREGAGSLDLTIRCDQKDVGRIIGRKGKTIDAIRALARGAASRTGTKVNIDIAE